MVALSPEVDAAVDARADWCVIGGVHDDGRTSLPDLSADPVGDVEVIANAVGGIDTPYIGDPPELIGGVA